jgi:hypothetical protein
MNEALVVVKIFLYIHYHTPSSMLVAIKKALDDMAGLVD